VTVPTLAASRIHDLVEAYLAADYQWELDGRWRPLKLGEVAVELEAAYPDAGCAGLLSAWNPHSVERSDPENRQADGDLATALAECGLVHRPAFSSARNRSWREPSWAVMGMPLAEFDALARRFGQLGTLFARRGEPMRLRIYRDRPAGVAEHALVDWVR
jgi:hypothetical protein